MLKKHFLLFVLILLVKLNFAQISWLPLDEPLNKPVLAAQVITNQNYISLQAKPQIGFRTAQLELNKWNGQFWSKLPPVNVNQFFYSSENTFAVTQHLNQYYIAGSFQTADFIGKGIIKWNGSSWETVAGGIESNYLIHPEISISDMVSFKNELFICGAFNIANKKAVHNFVVLNGNDWQNIDCGKGKVNDLHIIKDTLFAAGRFDQIDGKAASQLAFYHSGNWQALSSPSANEILALSNVNNQLVVISATEVFMLENGIWKPMGGFTFKNEFIGSTLFYQGQFFMAGTFVDLNGKIHHLLKYDGNSWSAVVSETDLLPKQQTIYYIHQRDNELIFSGNFKEAFGESVNQAIALFPKRTIVKGKVFEDKNQNCKWDKDEPVLTNTILSLGNNFYTSTDSNGNYNLVLEPNTNYQLQIYPPSDFTEGCRPLKLSISTQSKDSTLVNDFPLLKKPLQSAVLDISSHSGTKVIKGKTAIYSIICKDLEFPVRINLDYNPHLTFIQSKKQPLSQKEGNLVWEIIENSEFDVSFNVDQDKNEMGDSLIFILSTLSSAKVSSDTITQQVVASFDSNSKLCDKTEIEEGFGKLQYHIQFQNIGQELTKNLYVVDTIDATLPIQYIKITNYANQHKALVSYKVRNNAIIWQFTSINLPAKDQSSDLESSGFITYTAAILPGIKAGKNITNKASLYFDFQDPIVTNTTLTKVIQRSTPEPEDNPDLTIYPNPNTSDHITIAMGSHLIKSVEIFDLTGRKLLEHNLDQVSDSTTLNVSGVSTGVYIVRVIHTFGVISKRIIITR